MSDCVILLRCCSLRTLISSHKYNTTYRAEHDSTNTFTIESHSTQHLNITTSWKNETNLHLFRQRHWLATGNQSCLWTSKQPPFDLLSLPGLACLLLPGCFFASSTSTPFPAAAAPVLPAAAAAAPAAAGANGAAACAVDFFFFPPIMSQHTACLRLLYVARWCQVIHKVPRGGHC